MTANIFLLLSGYRREQCGRGRIACMKQRPALALKAMALALVYLWHVQSRGGAAELQNPEVVELCSKAYRAFIHKDFPEAEKLYQSGLALLQNDRDKDNLSRALILLDLSDLYEASLNKGKALSACKQAAEYLQAVLLKEKKETTAIRLIQCLSRMANLYLAVDNQSAAKEAIEKALAVSSQYKLQKLEASLDAELETINSSRSSLSSAEQRLFAAAFSGRDLNLASILWQARQSMGRGDLDSSRQLLEKALDYSDSESKLREMRFSENGRPEARGPELRTLNKELLQKALCLEELAFIERRQKKHEESFKHIQTAFQIRKAVLWKDHPILPFCRLSYLKAAVDARQWQIAGDELLKNRAKFLPLPHQKWTDLRRFIVNAESALAESAYKQQDYINSELHAKRALELALLKPQEDSLLEEAFEHRADYIFFHACNKLASGKFAPFSSQAKAEFGPSASYYEKASELAGTYASARTCKEKKAILRLKIASVDFHLGEFKRSKAGFSEAAKMMQELGDKASLAFCLEKIKSIPEAPKSTGNLIQEQK